MSKKVIEFNKVAKSKSKRYQVHTRWYWVWSTNVLAFAWVCALWYRFDNDHVWVEDTHAREDGDQ